MAAQVIGLGRDVESLRRLVDRHDRTLRTVAGRLADLEVQIRSLAATLADLSEHIAELAGSDQGSGAHRSWFDTTDPTQARSRLIELVQWLDRVYFQFPDSVLPSCWIWHPSVVEELLWLRRSWTEAFTGSTAAVFRVADWHDRQRPGVVARVRALNDGVCSLDQHARGAEQDARPRRTPAVDAVPAMAAWWAARREEPPPYPRETQATDDMAGCQ
jgi:hypothetical protein